MKGSESVGQEASDTRGDRLSAIETQLRIALEESDDDDQRYHIRKAAQRIVLAQESN